MLEAAAAEGSREGMDRRLRESFPMESRSPRWDHGVKAATAMVVEEEDAKVVAHR